MDKLKNNIIKIDNQINSKNNHINEKDFYKFMKLYENDILKIFENIKNEFDVINNVYFSNIIKYLKNFNLNFNELIKKEEDYLLIMFSSFIIKAFASFEELKNNNNNNEFTENYSNITFESDKIINNIIKNIKNLVIWFEIFYNKNMISKNKITWDSTKIRLGIFKIIIILKNKNIINFTKKWKNGKSLIFYTINIEEKNFIFINLFEEQFEIYEKNEKEIYLYIDHFTNIFELLKENIYSGEKINININSDFFKNLLLIRAKIDYNFLNFFFEIKLKKLKYFKENLKEDYNLLINYIKKAIKDDDEKSLSIYSQKLSEILDLIRINEIIKRGKDVFYYFPAGLCFRGRTYFSSSISFTFYKEIRCCLFVGTYENNFELPFHPLNKKIKDKLNEFTYKLENLKNFNFTKKNDLIKHSILWILISIAEIKKSQLGQIVSIEKFLNYSIKVLNNEIDITFSDEYDEFKFYTLKQTLIEIDKNIYIKRLISKDATASCFQHLIKILGHDEIQSLKQCNLDSEDTWYDPYSFILEKWKNKINDKNQLELINKYFTRSSIKKSIMTIQYGAKLNTCWKYFIKDIQNEDTTEIKEIFKQFYKYIDENVGLLKEKSENITKELNKLDFKIKLTDSTEINLKYFNSSAKQIKITLNNKRYTKQEYVIMKTVNNKKIKTASRANYIHIHDAAIIRYVISIKPILTIHDCFLIDYISITYLLSIVNEAMNKKFHNLGINKNEKEIYSIFIII